MIARRHPGPLLVALVGFCLSANDARCERWKDARTEHMPGGLTVTVSEPVLVARSHGYLWFPTLAKTADDRLLAIMNDYADAATATPTCQAAWSEDGGLTWSKPAPARYGDTSILRAAGDLLLLPYYLHPAGKDLLGPSEVIAKGAREIRLQDDAVHVTGWPRALSLRDAKLGIGGFVFNGQAVGLKDGGYLATLYGRFEGDETYSLVGAESRDGLRWAVRSVIADVSCGFKGSGPSESALCRLKDGRLMCVFRNDGNLEYGQTWSRDDGRTWDRPVLMPNIRSVQPSLVVLEDGMVVLSGGRPGVFVWINPDGSGQSWHPIDLVANHNATRTADPIVNPAAGGNTSSYTEVVSLGGGELRVIYDRLPYRWHAIPNESRENNSVWVVRLRVTVAR
jgi:hypothetical protein